MRDRHVYVEILDAFGRPSCFWCGAGLLGLARAHEYAKSLVSGGKPAAIVEVAPLHRPGTGEPLTLARAAERYGQ